MVKNLNFGQKSKFWSKVTFHHGQFLVNIPRKTILKTLAKDTVELIVARGPIPRQMTTISRSESNSSSIPLKPIERRWAHRETIILTNAGSGFGFGIVGGKATGVLIKTILPNGAAENDGRLRSGDIILKINGIDMAGMGSENAATILKETGNQVELEIARGELPQFDQLLSPSEEVFEVDLTKDSSGIGIHIAGWVNDGNSYGTNPEFRTFS